LSPAPALRPLRRRGALPVRCTLGDGSSCRPAANRHGPSTGIARRAIATRRRRDAGGFSPAWLTMARLSRKAFERLVDEALQTIPARFRDAMTNVAVVVEDEPSDELLDEMEIPPDDTLYGLYQGTPLTERTWSEGTRLPDRVTIFQRPIEEDAESEDDIVWMVGETVIHEFGHYFGLSEEEIEAIEERYWRGEDEP
jgi:predicted Zn-dependent protease with MMP-like domain